MKLKFLIGALLSAFFLVLAFRGIDFGSIVDNIRATKTVWLIPAVGLTLASFYLRAIRWKHLLGNIKDVPVSRLWKATMIGFMANNLLPARLGEIFRAHVIGRWESISRSSALATIGMERVFDLYTMLMLFGLVAVFFPLNRMVRVVGIPALALGILVLGGFIALQRSGPKAARFFDRALSKRFLGRGLPERARHRVVDLIASFQEGLGVLRHRRQLLWASFYSIVMWALIVLVIQCCFWAMDIRSGGEPIHPMASVVVLVVMALGLMVPSGPGFVGSLQFFAREALAIFSVDLSTAVSFSIVYHATQWFPVTIVGLLYLLEARMTLKDVAKTSEESAGDDVAAVGSEAGEGRTAP